MLSSVSRIGFLRRSLYSSFATHSSPIQQEASTGLTTTQSSGLLSILGIGGSNGIPMTESFPATVTPLPIPPPQQPPKTELTSLPNGFRVASEDIWGATSSIGLAIACGSQNESPDQTGVSHLLEYLAFKGSVNRTHFRVLQELTGIGANVSAHASREQIYYSIDCIKSDVPVAIEVLLDTALNPKFSPWEFDDIKQLLRNELSSFETETQQPQYLLDLLTTTAYSGGLGNPLTNTVLSLDGLTPERLKEFHTEHFRPNRMVLSAAGIDHGTLVGLVESTAGSLPTGSPYSAPLSSYMGGEVRKPHGDKLCHMILAFDVQGGWEDMKAACSMTVLLYLMGGGGSFSSGGPGKGMHSRLYLNVLSKYGWVHNFSAISQPFDKRCLAGVYGCVSPEWAPKLVEVMAKELISLSQSITKMELDRAKKAAIGQVLMTLENRAVAAEDIGRQVLTYGRRHPAQVFIDGLEKVSVTDLKSLVGNMIKTPLSMASMGSVAFVPRYSEVVRKFN
eukprot:g7300.t1